ncbi:biotin-dependent carboxyltransferase family protein [Litoribaculum gwangyangense]|uniref:Biotin-dependent carboxyltransferase family protein n=1 Tax=Litoribaculum gwangyangense TaxID=1130722 RepID=A0ABP9CHC2_9FLAO
MIKVLNTGFYSSIQDFGRNHYLEFGVPYSGVMDRKAASFANALLGNKEDEAVLEMTMTGAKLQFQVETFMVISGADMSPKLNDYPIGLNKVVALKPNDVLSFGKLNSGFRCYLAIWGGFKSETIMGSKSMCQNITEQFKLFKNDELIVCDYSTDIIYKNASVRFNVSYLTSDIVEVLKGPEFDLLSDDQKNQLLNKSFTISKDNNRMAYQLEENLKNNLKPIITSGVLPGTVQLTPSGKLIILMRDCQTTGGYPRVLQVKESSIDILAQKFTGNHIKFKFISS